jgi:uncharacterized protein (TIGR02453 family)
MALHPDTFTFLSGLKENNNKPYFEAHKKQYEAVKQSIIMFLTDLLPKMANFQPGVASLEPKKLVFRINRDVRFGKDKSPYKTNMGAWVSEGGKGAITPGYYLHLEPNNCFLAGGIYMPMPDQLKRIRQEIDYNFQDFDAIIKAKDFQKYFGTLSGSQLKNAPKDYEKDNPALAYLKYKDFTAVHHINDDKLVLSDTFVDYTSMIFEAMYPLNEFLNVTSQEEVEEENPLKGLVE